MKVGNVLCLKQENLSWDVHIQNISIKCSKLIGVNFFLMILPVNIKVNLYNSLMLPYINYGLMAWGFNCNRIIKLQKKAVGIICLAKYNAHTELLLKK